MKRPNYNEFPITDERTYLQWYKNILDVDWEKYAKDLEKYIDSIEEQCQKRDKLIEHLEWNIFHRQSGDLWLQEYKQLKKELQKGSPL